VSGHEWRLDARVDLAVQVTSKLATSMVRPRWSATVLADTANGKASAFGALGIARLNPQCRTNNLKWSLYM